MKDPIYFDYAAATPVDDAVQRAMQPYLSDLFYNPSATYLAAKQVARDVTDARQTVARVLGVQPAEVYFTSGGTEANNLAIRGVLEQFPDANVVVSAIEHESVLRPASLYRARLAGVDKGGRVNITNLQNLIDDETVLVSVMYANNEIGTIQPMREIAAVIRAVRSARKAAGNDKPLYFHTDACQAAAYLDLHVHSLGVDMMTLNGGKIYGPKQSGLLVVRGGARLQSQILGGGQERGLRSGTENVPGIVGLATALGLAQERRVIESERLKSLQQLFITNIDKELYKVIVNGDLKHRLPNNLNLTFPGQDNERLLMELDERGIMCASGSACNASSEEPSHVLRALGIEDSAIRSSLRFTFGRGTTEEQVNYATDQLRQIVAR